MISRMKSLDAVVSAIRCPRFIARKKGDVYQAAARVAAPPFARAVHVVALVDAADRERAGRLGNASASSAIAEHPALRLARSDGPVRVLAYERALEQHGIDESPDCPYISSALRCWFGYRQNSGGLR
jgi:hypothetical protein